MSEIFNAIVAGSTFQGQPTASQRRKMLVEQVTQVSVQLPVSIVQNLNSSLGMFWGSDDPQKLAEELDKKNGVGFTKSLFTLHAELAEFISSKVPSLASSIHQRPKNYSVTIKEDGSLIIVEQEE